MLDDFFKFPHSTFSWVTNLVLIKQAKHTLTWFWSEEKWLKSAPVLSLAPLGLLSLKLKGSASVVWASTLGSRGSRFRSVQRQLHFPTFSALNRGFTHKAHTALFAVPWESQQDVFLFFFSFLCVTGLAFVWHLNCTAGSTPLFINLFFLQQCPEE